MSQSPAPIPITPHPAPSSADSRPTRGEVDIHGYYLTHILAAAFPGAAGILLFGWRAGLMLAAMLATALIALNIWRRIGARGPQINITHGLWFTVLLWLMLPAHLFQFEGAPAQFHAWIPIGATLTLTILLWLLGGLGAGRVHPAIATYLLVIGLFEPLMGPTAILQRHRLIVGDLTRAVAPTPRHAYIKDGYLKWPVIAEGDALSIDPPSKNLLSFTTATQRPGRSWVSLESLLRDQMPPLEDLVIGAQPGPIGAGCAVAIIIGGLFLLYRGVIDFRVPITVIAGAYIALLSLPIPVIIREPAELLRADIPSPQLRQDLRPQVQWRWLAFREKRVAEVGLAKAITFANYQVMAGPLLMVAFFIATAPALRPMPRRARVIYGLLIGVFAAGFQLYLSVSWGPYAALLLVGLLSPLLERIFRQKALV